MARLKTGQGAVARQGIVLLADTDQPLYLTFDRKRNPKKPYTISTRYAPIDPGVVMSVQEWYWQNGRGGAGTTIETPQSNADGACEYGEFVWLRRRGVAQPSGVLTELALPAGTAALTSGQFDQAAMYNQDLYITTRRRYVLKVPSAGGFGLTEQDCGVGAITAGITVFNGTGAGRLYVGCTGQPIYEFDGTTWTAGAAGTERGWMEAEYWVIGPSLATGGAAGTAGSGATRLIGTNTTGTGFYHVSGDPKVSASWSTLTTVGPGSAAYPINHTVADNHTVWFATGQGCYGVDGLGYSPNLLHWVEATASLTNGQTVAFWEGLIWYAHDSGLVVFAPDGSRIDLGTFLNFGVRTGKLPIFGRPQVLAPAPDGLYVGYYNAITETSYTGILLKDPDGTYRWSMAESVISGQIVTFLRQQTTPTGDPGLFIGTVDASSGSLHLYRQVLPRYGNDPETDALNGGPFRAAPIWSLRLSRWNGARGVPNTLRSLSVEADYLGTSYPNNTIDVQLANDGNPNFATQGTATTSPRWSGDPLSGQVRASSSQIKLVVANTQTQPVVINSVSAQYTERPRKKAFVTYPILIAQGQQGTEDPWTTHNRLVTLQDADPIQVEDQYGHTNGMLVEDYSLVSEEQEPGKPWALHADLTLSTTRRVTRFDNGDLYDAGNPFS